MRARRRLDGADPINRDLRVWLPLDENVGQSARDISPYRRHSGLVNGRARAHGPLGKVYALASPNELINVGGPSSLGTTSDLGLAGKTAGMSAAIWAYFSGTSLLGALFKVGSATTGFGLGVGDTTIQAAGNNIVGLYENVRWINTSITFGTGWHHLAMTVDASGYPRIYYDGRQIYTDTTGAPIAMASGVFVGGYVGFARFFTGNLADFRVWGRTIAPGEVARLYREPWAGAGRRRPFGGFAPSSQITITGAGAFSFDAMGVSGEGRMIPHGVTRVRRRAHVWSDVPVELEPVVALAEGFADVLEVERAVDDALARYRALSERASAARRDALVARLQAEIVAAVEAAAERDDEDALLALL